MYTIYETPICANLICIQYMRNLYALVIYVSYNNHTHYNKTVSY